MTALPGYSNPRLRTAANMNVSFRAASITLNKQPEMHQQQRRLPVASSFQDENIVYHIKMFAGLLSPQV